MAWVGREQGQSGQSVVAFRRDRPLMSSGFFGWKKGLRKAEAAGAGSGDPSPGRRVAKFVSVEVTPETAAATTSFSNRNHDLAAVTDPMENTTSRALDLAGRLVRLQAPLGEVAQYHYDPLSDLSKVIDPMNGQTSLSYEGNGDLLTVQDANTRTTTYTPDNMDRIASRTDALWGSAALTYDLDGNLTNDGTNSYSWNARNQLAAFGGTGFAYDGLGRRVQNAAGAGLLYDGVNPVEELSGTTVTANLLTGLGVDENFTRTDSAGTRDFLTDVLGSTLALTDSSGVVQTQYSYEPFGKTTASGTASTNSFEYTGRENDGTGLYYYRARYYSPVVGRFVSEDPAGFGGGTADLYSYVANNPLDHVDPSGENPSPGRAGTTGAQGVSGGSLGEDTPQTTLQAQQQCVSNFYNSGLGEAVQFGSPLSLLPGWNPVWGDNLSEWGVAIFGKFGGLFGSGAIPGTTRLTTLSGTTTVGSPLELGAEAVLEAVEKVGPPVMAAATVVDIVAHGTCAMESDPTTANALLLAAP